MDKKELEELKNCVTPEDIKEYYIDKYYANKGASLVLSNRITVQNSMKKMVNVNVELEGLIGLAYRTLVYLKFGGEIGVIPINSGEKHYANRLHHLLKNLSEIKRENLIMRNITSYDLDKLIEKDLSKGLRFTTVYEKVSTLKDWILYANKKLPYILQLDDQLIKNSKKFLWLKNSSRNEKKEDTLFCNLRTPYSLKTIKLILSEAIQNIELYGAEIFEPAIYYIESRDFNDSKKYSTGFDFFKKNSFKFKEPNLKEIQKSVLAQKNKFINGSQVSVKGGIRTKIINAINNMEASCIIVSLMLTGMRGNELVTLTRHPSFEIDEYVNLKRMIYKTAKTKDGEPHDMPVPEIVGKAMNILSTLADIKDKKENNFLVLSSIDSELIETAGNGRLDYLVKNFCKNIGIQKTPSPHDFRHAMAFLIVYMNEKDGLELARMFLGHKSVTMTLHYLAHFNNELKETVSEFTKNESKQLINLVTNQIKENKFLFGENGKRLMPKHKFIGKQVNEFIQIMRKGLLKLIDDNKLAIIQTPICLCVHDLSKPEKVSCLHGVENFTPINNRPIPSNCQGANCSNSVFFEEHIKKLKDEMYCDIDSELKKRLEENTFFMNTGGFGQDPFQKLFNEYEKRKEVI